MSEKWKIFFPSFAFFGRKASFESLKMCFKVVFGYGYAQEELFWTYFQQLPESVGNFIEIMVPQGQNMSFLDLKSQK